MLFQMDLTISNYLCPYDGNNRFYRTLLTRSHWKCGQEGKRGTSWSQNQEIYDIYCNLGLTLWCSM